MKLFGSRKPLPSPPPYTFDGFRLSHNLVVELELPGWERGTHVYTEAERAAIHAALIAFQRDANESYGTEVHLHPELIQELTSRLGAEALHELAYAEWNKLPDKKGIWKACVATYLKAWADSLNPWTLIEVAEVLVAQGYRAEARRVLNVLRQFPEYAKEQGGHGLFSTEWVSRLQDRVAEISREAQI